MKIHLLTTIILVAFCASCKMPAVTPNIPSSGKEKTENRSVTGFKKVRAENAIALEISVQKGYSVAVKADDDLLPIIRTEVEGDTLVVNLKENRTIRSRITVTIAMPELTDIDLLGATSATVDGVKTDSLEVNATGASQIKLTGEVKSLDVKALGASTVDAGDLKADKASVHSVGASNITVNAVNELKAEAVGASSVTYIGDPKDLQQNASDVSSIKKK